MGESEVLGLRLLVRTLADFSQSKKLIHHDDKTLSKVANRYEAMQTGPIPSKSKAGTLKARKVIKADDAKPVKSTERSATSSTSKSIAAVSQSVSLISDFLAV